MLGAYKYNKVIQYVYIMVRVYGQNFFILSCGLYLENITCIEDMYDKYCGSGEAEQMNILRSM